VGLAALLACLRRAQSVLGRSGGGLNGASQFLYKWSSHQDPPRLTHEDAGTD